jgi:iron complex outermembrane receptor protein
MPHRLRTPAARLLATPAFSAPAVPVLAALGAAGGAHRPGRRGLLLGAAVTLALSAAPAHAQDQTGQRSGLMIEEITVTARKREENLQDVPLSITAFSRAQVERLNLSTLKDVAKFTPGLIFAEGLAPGDPRPSIRGQSNPRAASRPSVGIFIDGIPIGVGTGLNTQSLDIERIEVVKGPQSVQFGRDVLSGAVNYVTRRPSTEAIAGEVDALYGTGDRIDLKARVNVPINDVFAVSLAGRSFDFDGYYETADTGIPLGTETADSVAAAGVAQLGERGSVYLRLSYSDENVGQTAWANTPANTILGPSPSNRWFFGTFPTNESLLAINPIDYAGLDRQLFRSSLIADYDFGGVTLQSTTAWNKSNILNDIDTDWTAIPDTIVFGTILLGNLRSEFVREIEDYSQELRLSSAQDQRLRWMAGVYGFKEKITRKDFTRSAAVGSAAPRSRASVNRSRETTETLSGFGSLAFDITEALTVTGELRYSRDKLAVANPALVIPNLNASFKKWLPRVTLEYQVSDTLLLYANAGKGNKPGGFNTAAGAGLGQLPANLLAFQEEQAWQYEIGAKTSWLDERLTLNAAAFYTDWSNLVVNAQFQVPGTVTNIGYAANAGKADVKGFEVELRAAPSDWLDVYGGVSYAPSRLDNYADSRIVGAFGPNVIPTTNRRLPFVSDWTASAGFILTVPVSDRWSAFLQTDTAYRSKQYATVANVDSVGSRFLADVKIGLQHENYTLTFLVNNLFNNDRADSADAFVNPSALPFARTFLVQLPAPRNYGVRLQAKF